ELADAPDSKSGGAHAPCGFDSHLRHSRSWTRNGWLPKAGFARREARCDMRRHQHEEGGTWGKHGFPHAETRRTQNPVGLTPRVGSTPTFGTRALGLATVGRRRRALPAERLVATLDSQRLAAREPPRVERRPFRRGDPAR